jgi:hypothetical protein
MQTQQGQHSGRGNPQNEAIQIAKYLKGADFPASKDDLVECAQQNDAPEEVIEAIQALNDDNFESITDVTRADSGNGMRRAQSNDDDDDE